MAKDTKKATWKQKYAHGYYDLTERKWSGKSTRKADWRKGRMTSPLLPKNPQEAAAMVDYAIWAKDHQAKKRARMDKFRAKLSKK